MLVCSAGEMYAFSDRKIWTIYIDIDTDFLFVLKSILQRDHKLINPYALCSILLKLSTFIHQSSVLQRIVASVEVTKYIFVNWYGPKTPHIQSRPQVAKMEWNAVSTSIKA